MSTAYDPVVEDDDFDPDAAELEAPVDDAELEAEPELGPDDDQGDDDFETTVEERATALGWKPLAEFRGEPRLWRDAETFLRHGYEDPRVLRENNVKLVQKTARLERQLGEARGELAEVKDQMTEILGMMKRSDRAAYEQRKAGLAARRREAVENSDTSTFDQVEAEMAALEKEHTAPPAPAPKEQPRFDPAITDFIAANPWWNDDANLRQSMIAHYDIVIRTRKDLDIEDQLALAKRRLAKDFPDRDLGGSAMPTPPRRAAASEPRRPAAAGVARPTGATPPPRRREVSGFDTITDPKERAEARDGFAKAQREDPGITQEEYLILYNDPHADALELRRNRKSA